MIRSLTAVLGLSVGLTTAAPAAAQVATAEAVLQTSIQAMGTDTLQCLTYAGANGYVGLVGQNFHPAEDWARVELASYSRTVNYDAGTMREELIRRQGPHAARGGGGIPLQGEQQFVNLVNGDQAWRVQGTTVIPQPAAAQVRQLEIWLDPHGFLKGALAATDLVGFERWEAGERRYILAYTRGPFRLQGSIDPATNRIVRVQTFVPTPFLGDTVEEKTYAAYRQFGGIWFPTRFHHHTNWDHELRPQGFFGVADGGHNSFDLTIGEVEPNVCGEPVTVPPTVQNATVPPTRVESTELAEGVFYLTGGSHHSVAIEFDDFVTVVEAPQNETRSLAVIAEVYRLIPDKQIKYVVSTHHHFDHAGGLRAYVHEGAVPVAHRELVPYYYYTVMNLGARTLEPDRLSLYPPDEIQETFVLEEVQNDKYTISDGTRILDLYLVQGNPHAAGMLMAHLPAERILIEADLYTPPAANAPSPTTVSAAARSLFDNVERLGLEVDRIAPIHGRVVPWAEFASFVGEERAP